MGSIGAPEVLVVLVVALIVLGPNRLPDAARSIGKAFREFRRITSGFQDELRGALDAEPTAPTASTTPAETWVSTEEPASMSALGTAAAPNDAKANGQRQPEAGQPETGQPEASQPEASQPETGQPEGDHPSS